MADGEEYEIGFGKPPRENRFVKGVSGNPKGRPKGSMNLSTVINKIGGEPINVTENGRIRTITKNEAVVHQLMKKALSGDLRAMKDYLRLQQFSELSEEVEDSSPVLRETDVSIMKNVLIRLQQMERIPADKAQPPKDNDSEE